MDFKINKMVWSAKYPWTPLEDISSSVFMMKGKKSRILSS
jgi:hypothetical protein